MTTTLRPAIPRDVARARIAVALLFLTNGALFANLVPRYPAIKADLALSNADFGFAVASYPLGALIAGIAAGALIRRFRSSRIAVIGTVVTGLAVLSAGLAPSWLLLVIALFVAGASDAITDVAQNSHGLRVQAKYGRSILNSFHAIWSIGAVAGGLMGAAAAGLQIPASIHLSVSALVFCSVSLTCYRFLLSGPEPTEHPEHPGLADGADGAHGGTAAASLRRSSIRLGTFAALIALVVIASGSAIVEDAGATWAAVYLSGTLEASIAIAGFGFVALVGMQFIGRILGDSLVDRFGQRAVARAGGAIILLGMGTALLFPSIVGSIIGFGLAGLGSATLVPAAMHAADELPGFRRGTGLTLLSWLMRLGFLFSPPIVGLVADATTLRLGLAIVPVAGLLVLLLAGVLAPRTNPEQSIQVTAR